MRPHYDDLVNRLQTLSSDELSRRERLRDDAFRAAGITFTVYGEQEGVERTFPMDLVPRIIPADEWETASTSSATSTAPIGCSRTTSATRAASPMWPLRRPPPPATAAAAVTR